MRQFVQRSGGSMRPAAGARPVEELSPTEEGRPELGR